jgi:diadenosine tetraphosphate (Ap4A) HIT family hydrolase
MKKIFITLLVIGALGILYFQLDLQRFSKKSACAFCNAEVLERQIFYRGDKALGILTHKPAVPGHVLIIPERHVTRFEDLSAEEVSALGGVIKKVDLAVKKRFGAQDYILIQKNGQNAGQTVPHVHFHYLPASRFLAVKFFLSPWFKPLGEKELISLRESLKLSALD